jgi:hypothetical protein
MRELLIRFLDKIRDYERESHNLIGFDERESEEFVDIFIDGEFFTGQPIKNEETL